MATAVKDNKMFYKYINIKWKGKENLRPLLDITGNVTTEDRERQRFSMPSLHLSLKVRPVILRVLYSLGWGAV